MAQPLSDADRAWRYRQAAQRLHDHLESKLDVIQGYPAQVTWGYAMSALLSIQVGKGRLTKLGQAALSQLANQDAGDPNFSWEFVVMAIQKAKRRSEDASISWPCDEHRAKGTRMFNWFLLRQVNRFWFGCSPTWTRAKLAVAHRLYTRQDGLILDEFKTRSLQYHAFCLYLICDLVQQHPNADFLQDWLRRGVQISLAHVLDDGSAMWIGRGQEQVFGYAALIRATEFVHRCIEPLPVELLNRLQQRVLSFQRDDGSFPLVLRRREPEPPWPEQAPAVPGWYGYNTLADYLPFLGHAMWTASEECSP